MKSTIRAAAAGLVALNLLCAPALALAFDGQSDTPDVSITQSFSGVISGRVFNDVNNNGAHDAGEPYLEGWKVKLHMGDLEDGYNNPVVATDFTDAGGNYFFDTLAAGNYFVEEMEQDGWNQTTADSKVTLSDEHADVTRDFANVAIEQNGNGDGSGNGGDNNNGGNTGTGGNTGGNGSTTPPITTPPPSTFPTITIDASKVVCTNTADLPNWGKGGNGPITATTAKDWVAAHASCSLASGWSFEYGDVTAPYGGDTTVGHVNGFTPFGPTAATGSTSVTFTLATTSGVQVREVAQDGFIPFTFASDNTNNTVPSAQMYCASDVLNLDNADFIFTPTTGTTYYCVAFNSPKVAPPATPAPTSNSNGGSGGGNGGGGVGGGGGYVTSGPLSIGYVNTSSGGLVLGTSTESTSACNTPLLNTYMRAGQPNDKEEVKKLQTFLNTEMDLHLPVTGYFGSQTTSAVNAFQYKYKIEVLEPWIRFGLVDHIPTGYVYKTTRHKINMLACSNLNLPAPQLP